MSYATRRRKRLMRRSAAGLGAMEGIGALFVMLGAGTAIALAAGAAMGYRRKSAMTGVLTALGVGAAEYGTWLAYDWYRRTRPPVTLPAMAATTSSTAPPDTTSTPTATPMLTFQPVLSTVRPLLMPMTPALSFY